jgi:putative transcriptional regulator
MIRKNESRKSSKPLRLKHSKAGEDIVAGLEEGLAHLRGKVKLKTRSIQVPEDIDVSQVRRRSGLSQAQFAAKFGLNPRTLQDWECGRVHPETAVRAYLKVIDRNPEAVEEALRKVG